MLSQYEYGRDIRNDKKYEDDVRTGKYNQQLAIEQFLIDKQSENKMYGYQYIEDEDFMTENASWSYSPDYILITDKLQQYYVEVKVQMKPFGENVHIKQNQIDKLIILNGFVLYSTDKQYFIHSAKYLKEVSDGIIFSNKLNKKCYDIVTDKLKWTYWLHYPDYKSYASKYTSK